MRTSLTLILVTSLLLPSLAFAQTATDVVCTGCVGTTDIANGGVTSAKLLNNVVTTLKILNGTITDADISTAAAIDPAKISGTAWTANNDGGGSGLDADYVDGLASGQFLRSDQSGELTGSVNITGGYVGVGTTANYGNITIAPGDLSLSKIVLYGSSGGADSYRIGVETGGGIVYNADVANSAHFQDFRFNNNTVMRIQGDGNVGIGTTAPTGKLAIDTGTIDDLNKIVLYGSSGGADSYRIGTETGGGIVYNVDATDSGHFQDFRFNNATVMRIQGDGNVGIGTQNPTIDLAIGDNDTGLQQDGDGILALYTDGIEVMKLNADQYVKVDNKLGIGVMPDMGKNVQLAIGDNDTGLSQGGDGVLQFYNDNTERMRIASNGKVGIGTASPAAFTTISTTATDDVFRVNDDGDGDSTPFYISGGGRVGIGTTDNTDNKVHMVWEESGATTLVAENTIRDASNTTGIRGIVYASGNAVTGQPVAVRGDAENNSPSEGQYGVVGYNWATNQTSGLQGAGVFGGSLGTPGSEAEYTGRGHGVQGETYASNDNSAGGIFYSRHTTGEANAITGLTYSTDPDSYSFQGSGPTSATGTKSAIVNTASQGPTELYVMESPEVWFEDIGEGKLVNGQVTINLDPIFLETVTINDQHPLQVFVQPYANIDLYVQRGQNSFTVKTTDNTASNASFGYRVVAKRKHYEDQRLRKAKVPIDQFMEPGLTRDQLYILNEQWGLGEAFQDLFLMHPSITASTDSPL